MEPVTAISTPEGRAAVAPKRISLRQWIREHDESWIFVVVYLGLAVGLSVFVSLFWLVIVAALHFGLELIRQSHYREGGKSVVLHALWEVKLDVGLVLLALTLVLYIEVVLGILGLQSAARAAAVSRAGVRIGSRAAAWERNLRTFLLTVDEMARIGHAAVMFRKRAASKTEVQVVEEEVAVTGEGAPSPEPDQAALPGEAGTAASLDEGVEQATAEPIPTPRPVPVWRQPWGWGDRIGMALIVVGAALMLTAPHFTAHDWSSAGTVLMEELRPFPGAGGD